MIYMTEAVGRGSCKSCSNRRRGYVADLYHVYNIICAGVHVMNNMQTCSNNVSSVRENNIKTSISYLSGFLRVTSYCTI